MAKRYNLAYEDGDFFKVDDTDFDILIVQEKDELKQVFASKGKAVMYVRYYGYADLDSEVKATAEKIILITDTNRD